MFYGYLQSLTFIRDSVIELTNASHLIFNDIRMIRLTVREATILLRFCTLDSMSSRPRRMNIELSGKLIKRARVIRSLHRRLVKTLR